MRCCRGAGVCSRLQAILLVVGLTLTLVGPVRADDGEDELGNWLIWNGTLRFSERWTLFTEAQLRLYEVARNPNEMFVRFAGQYDLSPNALVAVGYMRSEVEQPPALPLPAHHPAEPTGPGTRSLFLQLLR